jgi:hypothetical protein
MLGDMPRLHRHGRGQPELEQSQEANVRADTAEDHEEAAGVGC